MVGTKLPIRKAMLVIKKNQSIHSGLGTIMIHKIHHLAVLVLY